MKNTSTKLWGFDIVLNSFFIQRNKKYQFILKCLDNKSILSESYFDFCTQSSLFMSRFCEITRSIPAVGHNVSKSNIKTKRMFVPNLKDVSFKSEILSKNITMRVNVRGIRTVMKHGGIDNFLLTTKVNNLTLSCQKLRRQLKKKTSAKVAVA